MVDGDRRDDGHLTVSHVGRVPHPAQADLDHRHVHRSIGKGGVGHGHQDLEVRHDRATGLDRVGVHHVHERKHVVVGIEEALLADRLTGDRDPFPHVVQMRAGESPGIQTHLPQQPFHHSRGGALTVGAGQVDDLERALRAAHQIHDLGHSIQRRLDLVLRGALHDLLGDQRHP